MIHGWGDYAIDNMVELCAAVFLYNELVMESYEENSRILVSADNVT